MGLDMYLEKRNKNSKKNEDWEEIAYWRKANQIREWFANNLKDGIENCTYSSVTKEDLELLLEACEKVLANPDLAPQLLPTSNGFFFGSTNYDEWYFDDLKGTIEVCKEVLNHTDWENEEVAYYEWW